MSKAEVWLLKPNSRQGASLSIEITFKPSIATGRFIEYVLGPDFSYGLSVRPTSMGYTMIEKDLATGRESESKKSSPDDTTGNSKGGIRSERMAPDAEVIASKGKRAPSKRIVVPD